MPVLPLDMLADVFPGINDLVGQLAPRSLIEYCQDAQHYLGWCAWETPRALDPQTLRAWRQHQVEHTVLSPNTINRRLRAIKPLVRASATRDALDAGLAFRFQQVEAVPLAPLRARLKTVRALTPEDVRRLCRAPDPTTLAGLRDRAMLTTLAGSGCRISELLTITIHDLLPQQGAWLLQVLGKGQARARRAPLSQEAVAWIQRWLAARKGAGVDVAAIFTGFSGYYQVPTRRTIRRNAAWLRIKAYGVHVGLPELTPHDLRRFVATQVAMQHGLRQAQRALGHARLETTAQHYILDELEPGLTEGLYWAGVLY